MDQHLTLNGITSAELELEIALKQRVAKTLESRIAWALLLEESLEKGTDTATSFKQAALDALSALEAPSAICFSREIPAPAVMKFSRPSPKPKFPPFRDSKSKFLYIKSSGLSFVPEGGSSSDEVYLLRCPSCLRISFTSLQGLLNHARISHGLEWGTHEECIRACAVSDPNLSLDAGIEVGLGPGGILPGLRSIFQMAVGQPNASLQSLTAPDSSEAQSRADDRDSSLLARTLGFHEDTPALAPFLGKQAIRRGIKIWNIDQNVDIDGLDESNHSSARNECPGVGRPWRMPYTQRNDVWISDEVEENCSPEAANALAAIGGKGIHRDVSAANNSQSLGLESPATIQLPSSKSRFHFVTRVIIMDRSMSVPTAKLEAHPEDTHKWMVSVDAPSYAYHITTVLKHITVTCPSDPTSISCSSNIAHEPPFIVMGTAKRPFLSCIELVFNDVAGTNESCDKGQTVKAYHWVDLDPFKSSNPVLGEEQILDIELDKGTIIKPKRLAYTPIGSKSFWSFGSSPLDSIQSKDDNKLDASSKQESNENDYKQVLRSLLSDFPMTLRDLGGTRPTTSIPYKLVPTPAHFKNLVIGRRKAIEWSRARALRGAYNNFVTKNSHLGNFIPLTVGDVYSWLSQNGYFPRASATSRVTDSIVPSTRNMEWWCRICGLGDKRHQAASAVKSEYGAGTGYIKPEKDPTLSPELNGLLTEPCTIMPQDLQFANFPMLDVTSLQAQEIGNANEATPNAWGLLAHRKAFVSAADPQLVLAVGNIADTLGLRTFLPAAPKLTFPRYPIDTLGGSRAEIEATLAPRALLALFTKAFAGAVISSGLDVAKRDKTLAAATSKRKPRRKGELELQDSTFSLLTPAHILSGVVTRGRGCSCKHRVVDIAVLRCLSRLGISVDGNNGDSGEGGMEVKKESL